MYILKSSIFVPENSKTDYTYCYIGSSNQAARTKANSVD